MNTAVYRADTRDGKIYFVKLRRGGFDQITVALPQYLSTQRIPSIIAPMQTRSGKLWASLESFKMILYPFIEGLDGYEVALSDGQWRDFGPTLKDIHATHLPQELSSLIPREEYNPHWRELAKAFQAQVEVTAFDEPVAVRFAAFMREKRGEISRLIRRADELAEALKARPLVLVLCHADIHAGNLHISPDGKLYLVDWDNPIYAPKERDLAMIGGSAVWSSLRQINLFYQGYGDAQVDLAALAYYRCERAITDIAEFCRQLLLTDEGGQDREQSYGYFTSSFLPGHEIDLALKTDMRLGD